MAEEMWERTPGGAVLADGNRLRDELVVDLKGRVEITLPCALRRCRRRQAESDLCPQQA